MPRRQWEVGEGHLKRKVFEPWANGQDKSLVAACPQGPHCEADARLIAAAPDLLKALNAVVEADFDASKWPLLQDTIRAVIAKAT